MSHDFAVWAAKTIGLFYLVGLSVGVLLYVFWPGNAGRFEAAARMALDEEEQP